MRSLLFCPGNHPRRVVKVFTAGADAAILDLEDAVAHREKPAARASVVAALRPPRPCRGYVRINAIDTVYCAGDIEAVVSEHLDGIVLPKVESAAHLAIADWALRQAERARDLREGSLDLIPIIETALGVLNLREIATGRPERVRRLAFGAGDFTLDCGMTWTKHGQELLIARTQVVLVSRATGLEAPLDTVYADLRDREGFERDTRLGRELGFAGRMCIHPDQVSIVNAIYAPTEAEIAWSRRVVEAFRAAEAAGSASIQLDGQFIDYPIVRKAERIFALGGRIGKSAEGQRTGGQR